MAKWWPSLLLSATLLLSFHDASSSSTNNATDLLALLSFKSMLSDDSTRLLASWNDSVHFCTWPGVACGGPRHHQRVVSLVLSSLNMSGPVPSALANLTFLRTMDLSSNKFHGHIPQEFGRLFRLQHLNLSMNSLDGSIPETLSNCSRLQNISIQHNLLTGKIPPGLGKCSDLRNLNLGTNSLTGTILPELTNLSFLSALSFGTNKLTGSIPSTIGNLHSLTALSLANNQLSGEIPSSMGQLSKLTILGLPKNELTGEIPPSIWNLSSLLRLSFAYNNLSGSLPSDAGKALPLIQEIYLYHNHIHGPIPSSLSNATRLEIIDISFNNFSGTIPLIFGNMKNLQWLHLSDNMLEAKDSNGWSFLVSLTNCTNLNMLQLDTNKLGGILPHSISNLSTNLQLLSMQNNGISGNIPPEIRNLVSLENLDLGPNLLTGSIPASFGMLQELRALDLDGNKLSGEIPSALGNLTQLISLFLDDNELNGSIPVSLGNCQNLNLLNLDSNKLTGTIPKEIFTIFKLSRYLGLAFNSLTGSIPVEVGNLKNLQYFFVNTNKLSGEIPSSLGECVELEKLELRGNFFYGSIPSSFGALRGLQGLDLSQNNLTGRIPEFLQDFHFISYLNLSFNSFEGPVPRNGVFGNATALSILGNDKLCGGNPDMHLPTCSSESPNKKYNHHHLILVISAAILSLFFSVLLYFFVACYCMKKPRSNHSDSELMNEQGRVSYAELATATNGFSSDNLIGYGSFARVYKGMLNNDSMQVVAVKVLNLQLQGASKSFMAECEALRNIRHRNLVRILTSCSGVDFQGNDFKAVVLEFMGNGNLDDWLHPKVNELLERKNLNLLQRLNIAIDVASAVDYLHHHVEKPIVHCDLKPSNVLLDDDMVAHVGDFGLARFLKQIDSESSQCSTSSIGLRGTIGYVPPEYGMANEVSTRGDMYSYGILLLEMFTAKRPTDDVLVDGLSLRKFVETALSERVTDVIDARLLYLDDAEETEVDHSQTAARAIDCTTSILRIGIFCSNELPKDRLEMGEVLKELHMIRDASGLVKTKKLK